MQKSIDELGQLSPSSISWLLWKVSVLLQTPSWVFKKDFKRFLFPSEVDAKAKKI